MPSDNSPLPAVSVILPTYNRAAFLPAAFESIANQTFTNWELIVVDDGSTDDTVSVVEPLTSRLGDRVRYVTQANRGAYAARNRGLAEAAGRYVAFFDSDDLWLPHHLERCVDALEHHGVDWAFGSCRMVDSATGRVIEPTTFHDGGKSRPFLDLAVRREGAFHIVIDPRIVECQLLSGLYCGLQNSVIRRSIMDGPWFDDESRVVDDEMFVVRVMVKGARFGYYLDTHVIYHVHDDNSSASATAGTNEKAIGIYREMTRSLERLLATPNLDARVRRAIKKRLGREYFWHLGYVTYWQSGHHAEALDSFRRGLGVWPWDPSAVKTYLLAQMKVATNLAR